MILLANILLGIAAVLDMILGVMILLVVVRAVISWVNPDPFNPIVRFLTSATEPFLVPLRRKLPLTAGGIDFAPLVLLLLLVFLQYVVAASLRDYAYALKQQSFAYLLMLS